jgi:hypothetical protein
VSQATRYGFFPSLRTKRASLPAAVVLPWPLRPASITTVGGLEAKVSLCEVPPIRFASSSLTILTTCCPGLSAFETSAPVALSRTLPTNSLTTA